MTAKKKTTKKAPAKQALDKESPKDIVAEVLKQADERVEAGKEKVTFEDEGRARVANQVDERNEHLQSDYIPGTRMRDMTALPEYIFDERRGERRLAFGGDAHSRFHYCWVEGSDITKFKTIGYRLVPYNGGRGGLPSPGFSGSGMYECDISGHILMGDVYLMYCDIRLYEELVEEDRQRSHQQDRLGETNFANLGYRHGVRTFTEVDGVRESN